jgi:hypothetical protein
MALVLTDSGPVTVVMGWGTGLSGLLEFMKPHVISDATAAITNTNT